MTASDGLQIRRGRPRWRAAAGGALTLAAGLLGLGAVIVAAYGESAACWAWSLRLGLAGSVLASACAQTLVLVGGWLIWRSRRTAP